MDTIATLVVIRNTFRGRIKTSKMDAKVTLVPKDPGLLGDGPLDIIIDGAVAGSATPYKDPKHGDLTFSLIFDRPCSDWGGNRAGLITKDGGWRLVC